MIPVPAWLSPRLIAAGVAVIAFGVLVTALVLTRADLKVAEASLASLQTRYDALTEQLTAARGSASNWEMVAKSAQAELNARIEREIVERALAERAVAEARRRTHEANATLAAWLDRYAEATRDAECAAQLNRPICLVGATP